MSHSNRFKLFSILSFLLPIGLMRLGVTEDAPAESTKAAAPEPSTFSVEYVRELRAEAKAARLRAQALEQEGENHKTAAQKAAEDAVAAVKAANESANNRILRAELKAVALAAGMIDMDGLKLADLSGVKLKDDGTIEGADTMLATLKAAKPYLFGAATSTSTTKATPDPKDPKPKFARDMTPDEYRAARDAFR